MAWAHPPSIPWTPWLWLIHPLDAMAWAHPSRKVKSCALTCRPSKIPTAHNQVLVVGDVVPVCSARRLLRHDVHPLRTPQDSAWMAGGWPAPAGICKAGIACRLTTSHPPLRRTHTRAASLLLLLPPPAEPPTPLLSPPSLFASGSCPQALSSILPAPWQSYGVTIMLSYWAVARRRCSPSSPCSCSSWPTRSSAPRFARLAGGGGGCGAC